MKNQSSIQSACFVPIQSVCVYSCSEGSANFRIRNAAALVSRMPISGNNLFLVRMIRPADDTQASSESCSAANVSISRIGNIPQRSGNA